MKASETPGEIPVDCIGLVGEFMDFGSALALRDATGKKITRTSISGADRLEDVWGWSNVRKLDLWSVREQVTNGVLARVCKEYPFLESLRLAGCDRLSNLSPVRSLFRLRHLDLDYLFISNSRLALIENMSVEFIHCADMIGLQSLRMTGTEKDFETLSALQGLTDLNVSNMATLYKNKDGTFFYHQYTKSKGCMVKESIMVDDMLIPVLIDMGHKIQPRSRFWNPALFGVIAMIAFLIVGETFNYFLQ